MELNTHACLLRGRSSKVTAIKRLDLEVYKLEEVKSNGGKKQKNFLIRLKAQSARCFFLQAMIAATSSDTRCDERLYAGAQNGRLLTSGPTHKKATQRK